MRAGDRGAANDDGDDDDGYLSDGAMARCEATAALVMNARECENATTGGRRSANVDNVTQRMMRRVEGERTAGTTTTKKFGLVRTVGTRKSAVVTRDGEDDDGNADVMIQDDDWRAVAAARERREGARTAKRLAVLRDQAEARAEKAERDAKVMQAESAECVKALRATIEAQRAELARRAEADGARAKAEARAKRAEEEAKEANERFERARRDAREARERVKEGENELERALSSLEVSRADAVKLRRSLADATEKTSRQEARVLQAVRAAESLKSRAEFAERQAEHVEARSARMREGEAAHSCELLDRAKTEVLDARARTKQMEAKVAETTEELERMRERLTSEVERARLEGVKTFKTRMEAMTAQRESLDRELQAKSEKVADLERVLVRARTEFNELQRGAAYKVNTLEKRCAELEQSLSQTEALAESVAAERDRVAKTNEQHAAMLTESTTKDATIAILLSKLEEQLCELHARADEATKKMKTQRKGDAAKIGALQRKIDTMRRARDAAKAQIAQLIEDNEQSLMRISVSEVQLREAEEMVSRANREWFAERRLRESAEAATSRAENEVAAARERLALTESTRSDDAASLAAALEQSVSSELRAGELSHRIEDLESRLASANDALASAREDIRATTSREQQLRWRSQELESENSNLRTDLERQTAAVADRDVVEADLARREEALADAEARVARLNVELADAKMESRLAKQDAMKMSMEIDRLRSATAYEAPPRLLAASPDPSDPVAPGALALSPDQLVNDDNVDEQTERSESVKNKPVAFNPFAADKENATASKSTPPTSKSIEPNRFHRRFARPADVAPLSPLSLLNVR